MRPAEFKTAQQSLGLSDEFVAARIGVHVNMVGRYGHPSRQRDVPAAAEETMRRLLADFDEAVTRTAAKVQEGHDTVIPRYPDVDAFYGAVPQMAGWGPQAQGLLLAEVQRRIHAPIEYTAAS